MTWKGSKERGCGRQHPSFPSMSCHALPEKSRFSFIQLAGDRITADRFVAGFSYIMRLGYELPELMFSEAEIEARVLGARIIEPRVGQELAAAAAK